MKTIAFIVLVGGAAFTLTYGFTEEQVKLPGLSVIHTKKLVAGMAFGALVYLICSETK